MSEVIPLFGVLTGIVVPLAVFYWLYHEGKKEPIDYRRGGVITLFVGVGIYLFGAVSFGSFFEGIGLLLGAIGVGTMIAGYLYPNTSEELTHAVEEFEKP